MRSIKFPDMFSANSTNVYKETEYHEATMQNTELLLLSERGELFGDPYYGVLLRHYLYDQNTIKLRDVIIDILYTQLALFIPQVRVKRENIDIIQDQERGKLYCRFTGTCLIDYKVNTYRLLIFEDSTK